MSSREYQQKFDEYTDQGYRIVQVDGYEVDGRAYFAAIWEKARGPAFIAHHNMDAGGYQQKFNEYLKQGYRLVQVDGYGIGNRAYFAAIWEKARGPAFAAHHNMTGSGYQDKFDSYVQDGYRLKMVSAYTVNGEDYYAAIWEKSTGPAWRARHLMTSLGYQNQFDNHRYSGYRLRQVSGYQLQ